MKNLQSLVELTRRAACCRNDVLWFLEKKDDLLVCEIRRAPGTQGYEFEIADATGPRTIHCESPQELIAKYLAEHSRLMRDGWRPRAGNISSAK